MLLEKLGKLFKRCASAEPEFWLPGSESGEGAPVRSRADWEAVLSRFAARTPDAEVLQKGVKPCAVLRDIDSFGGCAENAHTA